MHILISDIEEQERLHHALPNEVHGDECCREADGASLTFHKNILKVGSKPNSGGITTIQQICHVASPFLCV